MADGGYQVTTGDLHGHVSSVQQAADAMGQALAAAQQVSVGVQAYGMICGPLFVPIVLAVSAPGLVALGMAQQSLTSMAGEVEQTAAHYDAVQQKTAESFTAIIGELS